MKPVVLFRKDLDTENEIEIARKYLDVYEQRTEIPENSLVIGRYSVLPFYRELEKDLLNRKSRLINTYEQHRWIANFDYYYDLEEFTAESWTDHDFYRCEYPGPFVVKGKTNSRKHQWKTHMFAEDKRRAIEISRELFNDSLIGSQEIIYRKYIPLKTYEIGINGLPFTNEWRFFYYKTNRLSYGFYWTGCMKAHEAQITEEGLQFADTIAARCSAEFFVLDIAEKEEGGWVLIEINDASQSGLSLNDPNTLYSNLATILSQNNE